jgi:hypothetical protein
MFAYGLRGTPWSFVATAAVVVLALMDVVRRWPGQTWPLQGIAVGLVACAVAWCLDEPLAEVVDSAPRGLAWRTASRAPAIVGVLAGWLLATWWARDGLFGHARDVALQGVGAAAIAAAVVGWRRAWGEPSPGQRFGIAVVPAVTAWVLVRPLDNRVPLFPFTELGDWAASRTLWFAVLIAGVGLAVLALAAPRWWLSRFRTSLHRW